MNTASVSKTYRSRCVVSLLLNNGANVNLQDNRGFTALIHCVNNLYENCSEKTIKLLLRRGANIDLKNDNNDTVISIPFQHQKYKNVINILLPNRKVFNEKVLLNKNKILFDKSKFWKIKSCDFKIIYKMSSYFREIILMM